MEYSNRRGPGRERRTATRSRRPSVASGAGPWSPCWERSPLPRPGRTGSRFPRSGAPGLAEASEALGELGPALAGTGTTGQASGTGSQWPARCCAGSSASLPARSSFSIRRPVHKAAAAAHKALCGRRGGMADHAGDRRALARGLGQASQSSTGVAPAESLPLQRERGQPSKLEMVSAEVL